MQARRALACARCTHVIRAPQASVPDSAQPKQRPRREKSLLARALGHLARREHSRAELARKLAPFAQSKEQLEALLADLQTRKLLSEERFTDMLTRSRGERFGAARVRLELRAHGLSDELVRKSIVQLSATEVTRAREVWRRKFRAAPADAAERARQMRFLAQRGFSTDAIRRVVGGQSDDD